MKYSFTSCVLYVYQTNLTSFNHSTNIKCKVQIIKRIFVYFSLTFHEISFKSKYSHPLFSKILRHMPNSIIVKCSSSGSGLLQINTSTIHSGKLKESCVCVFVTD